MTEEPEEKRCDPEDVICQMQVLAHLKGLKSALGDDRFKADFPELGKLDEKISAREADLKEALEKCGLPLVEEYSIEPITLEEE